jgi:hypothetical protein
MDSFNFRIRFCERYESIEKVADLLKSNQVLLSPDENSLDFGDLLSEIDSCCKVYSDDPEPFRNKFEIGDLEFRISGRVRLSILSITLLNFDIILSVEYFRT